MFWFDRANDDVVFGDIRQLTTELCDGRMLRVEPDVLMDFTAMPFADASFPLVVFDPPHLDNLGDKSWMSLKYGNLPKNWRDVLRDGFAECFRVLTEDGVLVFKWNESRIKIAEVLNLTPIRPLFGHPTGNNGKTHWCVFMKPAKNPERNTLMPVTAMTKESESEKGFIRGMAWGIALCSRWNIDAGGMLKESGISVKEFKAAGVMESDMKEIRKAAKERNSCPK